MRLDHFIEFSKSWIQALLVEQNHCGYFKSPSEGLLNRMKKYQHKNPHIYYKYSMDSKPQWISSSKVSKSPNNKFVNRYLNFRRCNLRVRTPTIGKSNAVFGGSTSTVWLIALNSVHVPTQPANPATECEWKSDGGMIVISD